MAPAFEEIVNKLFVLAFLQYLYHNVPQCRHNRVLCWVVQYPTTVGWVGFLPLKRLLINHLFSHFLCHICVVLGYTMCHNSGLGWVRAKRKSPQIGVEASHSTHSVLPYKLFKSFFSSDYLQKMPSETDVAPWCKKIIGWIG